jgi:1,4-dihydroxy-2-naphthoate polyprenyltransferase
MNVWVEAARPRTLPAAITPVVVGTATVEEPILLRAMGALIVALSLQIAVNYANDYYDGIRGVDTHERTGPRRAVASGDVAPAAMKRAVYLAIAVAGTAGFLLALAVGYELLLVGALCIVAALGYSGGPRPYASTGLGELFVFVFFGLVATIGSAYVQTETIRSEAVISGVGIGLLASAILVVNNLRDERTDASAGKITLAVRLGAAKTRTLYVALLLGAYPPLVLIAGVTDSPWPLLPFVTLPLTRPLIRAAGRSDAHSLIGALAGTARLQLLFGLLLATGLWIA